MRRRPQPPLVRLIDEGAIHLRRHVTGVAVDVHLDAVNLQVGIAIRPLPRFLRRFRVSHARRRDIDPGAIQDTPLLLVAQPYRILKVGLRRPQHERGGDAVVGVQPQLREQLVANRLGGLVGGIHVRVSVDETRNDGPAREIDAGRAGWNRDGGRWTSGFDPAIAHDKRRGLDRRPPRAVDQASTDQRDRARGIRLQPDFRAAARCLGKRRRDKKCPEKERRKKDPPTSVCHGSLLTAR